MKSKGLSVFMLSSVCLGIGTAGGFAAACLADRIKGKSTDRKFLRSYLEHIAEEKSQPGREEPHPPET